MNKKKCVGCGAILQDEFEQEIGFVPNMKNEYCKRCFRLTNYNELISVNIEDSFFTELLTDLAKNDDLFVLVIDIFTFSNDYLKNLYELLLRRDLIIVINKFDVLPRSTSENKMLLKVKETLKKKKIPFKDVIICSALKKWNIDNLLLSIDKHRNDRNVYFVGVANSGKSTIVNAIISAVSGENTKEISVSNIAGTTLSTVEIPLTDNKSLYDTPGLIQKGQISKILTRESNKIIELKSEVRPQVFQINKEQSYFCTGLIELDFPEVEEKFSITFYCSNNINIHRTKYENAENIRLTHLGTNFFQTPTFEEMQKIDFITEEIKIPRYETDIIIPGIGWVNFNKSQKSRILVITYPRGMKITKRKALI